MYIASNVIRLNFKISKFNNNKQKKEKQKRYRIKRLNDLNLFYIFMKKSFLV